MPRRASRYSTEPDVAGAGRLIGDPIRASMLFALIDGRPQPATSLAVRARASPQAASNHLARLVAGGLIICERSGRERRYRLASGNVANALEALSLIARPGRVTGLAHTTAMQRLQAARSCYDHLAGKLGVGIADALLASKALRLRDGAFALTRRGESVLDELAIDLAALRNERRPFACACTDWTERRPHVAGALGAALLTRFVASGWVERIAGDRALRVTSAGTRALEAHFGIFWGER